MKTDLTVLGIDVGRMGGWAYLDQYLHVSGEFNFKKGTFLTEYENQCNKLLKEKKPDVVVTGKPVRYYDTLVLHSALQAIIELCCEKMGIQFMKITDSQAKKAVLGKAKVEKEEIMHHFGVENEHQADAMLFGKYVFGIEKSII